MAALKPPCLFRLLKPNARAKRLVFACRALNRTRAVSALKLHWFQVLDEPDCNLKTLCPSRSSQICTSASLRSLMRWSAAFIVGQL